MKSIHINATIFLYLEAIQSQTSKDLQRVTSSLENKFGNGPVALSPALPAPWDICGAAARLQPHGEQVECSVSPWSPAVSADQPYDFCRISTKLALAVNDAVIEHVATKTLESHPRHLGISLHGCIASKCDNLLSTP